MIVKYQPPAQQFRRGSRSLIVAVVIFMAIAILLVAPFSNPGFLAAMRAGQGISAPVPTRLAPAVMMAQAIQAPTLIPIDSRSTLLKNISPNVISPAPTLARVTLETMTTNPATTTITTTTMTTTENILPSEASATQNVTATLVSLIVDVLGNAPTQISAASIAPTAIASARVLAPTAVVSPPVSLPTPVPTSAPTPVPIPPIPAVVPTLPEGVAATTAATSAATTIATTTVASLDAVGAIQLLAPPAATTSAQSKVDFAWAVVDQPLAPDHCTELVFWDPNNPADQRSPVGAGKETRKHVAFDALTSNADPLLRTLALSRRPFAWGVRVVSCTAPQVVLREAEEVRTYLYQP